MRYSNVYERQSDKMVCLAQTYRSFHSGSLLCWWCLSETDPQVSPEVSFGPTVLLKFHMLIKLCVYCFFELTRKITFHVSS